MVNYVTNIIETNQQDGSVKCVLGTIVEDTRAKLSKKITAADGKQLIALAEQYSAPAIVEFLGRHILAVAASGRKTHKSERAEELYRMFDKIGIALYASSIAIDALADENGGLTGAVHVPVSGDGITSNTSATEEEFMAKIKTLERRIARHDGRKKK